MTTEEKAKAYDEALEKARKIHNEILDNEILGFPDQIREIFPELRGSEDERMMKNIRLALLSVEDVFWRTHGLTAKEAISYLEKQKDQKPNFDTHWENGSMVYEQKEQNSIEDVIKSITKNKEAATKFLKSAGIMDDNGELVEMYRSEQKSADYNYDNRIQYDSIKSGVEAFASTYSFNIESKLFSQLTKEQQQLWREEIEQAVVAGGENGIELARDNRYKENRMVEWSEKDKNELATIIGVIEDDKADAVKQYPKCKALHNAYDRMLHFLKSFRPSWKPSEEQMSILKAVKEYVGCSSGYWGEGLGSLIEDLEKLM